MNRPKATDEKYLKGYDVVSYQKDLELYCDQLEEKIKDLEKENIEKNDELIFKNERIMELHKGFDKACELIEKYSGSCPFDTFDKEFDKCKDCQNTLAECWKEWCMEDEIV